jgi:predicted amidohydrolase
VIVNAAGEIVSVYRKIHLFDLDLPDGPEPVKLMESDATAPGEQVVACASIAGCLGVTVCYDLRFPELFQKLRFDRGAEVLLMPSAFTRPTGQAHWEVLLRARAIETQCFVVAAAQVGTPAETQHPLRRHPPPPPPMGRGRAAVHAPRAREVYGIIPPSCPCIR